MQGVEILHCNAAIEAILKATYALWNSTVDEALRPILRYGKSDTLGMDAMPEITIVETLQNYDRFCVVITEETGDREKIHFYISEDPRRFRTVFISDPTDRSSQLKKAMENVEDKSKTVSAAIFNPGFLQKWEQDFGKPACITGGSSAITCVRRGIPIFSVIVNYITRQLFLACSAGCYVLDLPENQAKVDLDSVLAGGRKIFFCNVDSLDDQKRFITFMGKSGYKENFIDSRFMNEDEMDKNLYYDMPGGPPRMLYLSTLQSPEHPIGFVLSNGEKITEWIHWLPYVRFARKECDQGEPALRLFEVYQDRPWTKEGILMSTPPSYSIFMPLGGEGRMVIDVSQFSRFCNPSFIRSTLILALSDNIWATRAVNQYGYRPIVFFSE